uniref:Uncharacterized protein n=1 Tax=Cacopsylla melanoneura TaxID=428564 RepID=A0A8D8SMM8_9HEMI
MSYTTKLFVNGRHSLTARSQHNHSSFGTDKKITALLNLNDVEVPAETVSFYNIDSAQNFHFYCLKIFSDRYSFTNFPLSRMLGLKLKLFLFACYCASLFESKVFSRLSTYW